MSEKLRYIDHFHLLQYMSIALLATGIWMDNAISVHAQSPLVPPNPVVLTPKERALLEKVGKITVYYEEFQNAEHPAIVFLQGSAGLEKIMGKNHQWKVVFCSVGHVVEPLPIRSDTIIRSTHPLSPKTFFEDAQIGEILTSFTDEADWQNGWKDTTVGIPTNIFDSYGHALPTDFFADTAMCADLPSSDVQFIHDHLGLSPQDLPTMVIDTSELGIGTEVFALDKNMQMQYFKVAKAFSNGDVFLTPIDQQTKDTVKTTFSHGNSGTPIFTRLRTGELVMFGVFQATQTAMKRTKDANGRVIWKEGEDYYIAKKILLPNPS